METKCPQCISGDVYCLESSAGLDTFKLYVPSFGRRHHSMKGNDNSLSFYLPKKLWVIDLDPNKNTCFHHLTSINLILAQILITRKDY